ncbi:hypothetical protein BABINDRAFT_80643 [Babjeviella inositovora NRRL Y-12698]|uniref:RNA polymerase II subunit A C-terminal domain phosphatase n=1 Tax=Babjeviella inositovora NRRL Y-12698 TaxID=984486 RepID=A0A1E3QZV7_9ASCO|nr:uncharacterized protein BABINDRAFT_80643 [Babjeviella inositovora NRRL Y-12698]ODQ83084.1 hypothetical protein BABINDRAFT_80643 [Babjeviella inositovora NRRL Y-12698]
MEHTATPITLPAWVQCPVTIEGLYAQQGTEVAKNSPFLRYKYWEYRDDPTQEVIGEAIPEYLKKKVRVELIGNFEFPVAGKVVRLHVRKGQEIGYAGELLAEVLEACAHAVQFGGLCALCGISLEEEKTYSGYSYDDRAPISMSHDTAGLKISLDEAERVENTSTKRLLDAKKLILVVDLDQTVIHATVDPTVGEWMNDKTNPNHSALEGVQAFSLEEHPVLPPLYAGPKPPPIKSWYYVKLRPGLGEFLERVSKIYELHIYTMATRTYAANVAKIIDPEGKFFGDRILSRDESGSMTHKSLERLFPVDTSLVVVIDDRGDVWQWCDNLIKVVPYDFFVGIGDINSSFLPKLNLLIGPSKRRKSIEELEEKIHKDDKTEETSEERGEEEGEEEVVRDHERAASLEAQQQERPLAKLQKDLTSIVAKEHPDDPVEESLLSDDDGELDNLGNTLYKVHECFYEQYSGHQPGPEIATVMPAMKRDVLKGLTFLFLGLLPLNKNPETVDIVIWARSFGAQVVMEPYDYVTHVICKNPGTFKVRYSRSELPDCQIVNPDWLFECFSKWERANERKYLIFEERFVKLSEAEITKYKTSLQRKAPQPEVAKEETYETVDNMDWDDLNKEVEDFLSSDNDDEEDADDEVPESEANGSVKRTHESEEEEGDLKRPKIESVSEDDMDALEKELMQGFEDMESEDE